MSGTNTLSSRMKRYELVTDTYLARRMPVVIRIDGVHFKSFTKGMVKPFDKLFRQTMAETMLELCKNIEGAVIGYTQSDEISIVLVDYKTLNTDAWFDYRVSKLCSVSSAMATRFFNKIFLERVNDLDKETRSLYQSKLFKADFDCRVFNVPREDVCNNLIWRQKDAERNSIQSVARSVFKHKELNGLNLNQLQNKLLLEKDINWNNFDIMYKRGCTAIKNEKGKWFIDYNTPIFSQSREYIESLLKEEQQ